MSHRLNTWSIDRMLVCVPAEAPPRLTEDLASTLRTSPSVNGVLEVLTASGLAETPPFLCAAVEDLGVRVVIRGDLRAVAHGSDGTTVDLGAGRSATWNDDVVTDMVAITIDHDDGSTFTWLPPTSAVPPASPAPQARPVPLAVPAPTAPVASRTVQSAPPAPPVPATPAVAPSPAGGDPAGGTSAPHDRTLDSHQFEQLVGPPDSLPDPDEEPVPTPPAAPGRVAPAASPAPDMVSNADDDPLDFSGLLAGTSHGTADSPGAAPVADPSRSRDQLVPTTVAPSAPEPASTSQPAGGQAHGSGLGEHDGRTVTLAELRNIQQGTSDRTGRTASGANPTDRTPPPSTGTPRGEVRAGEVRAVRCPVGHANPHTAAACRICGAPITDPAVTVVPRPSIARLVFDSGLIVDVDRPQVIGRRPTTPTDGAEIPGLVTMASPDGDISRAHTAIRVEGWDLLVEDLGSTNGTEIRLPGRDPIRLREHDPVLVVIGTEVTMAGAVQFRIEAPEA